MARRRTWLAAAPVVSVAVLAGCGGAPLQGFGRFADVVAAVEALAGQPQAWRHTGVFTPAQVLLHAAQSVEYSMAGFPAMRGALFRHTLGAAAFAVFDARGAMSHGLDEVIPGAPPVPGDTDLTAAAARLLAALQAFERHEGALQPHFAFGALDKVQYTRVHLMHLSNHWTELVRTA